MEALVRHPRHRAAVTVFVCAFHCCQVQGASSQPTPADTARRVHDEGQYADELPFAEGTSWLDALKGLSIGGDGAGEQGEGAPKRVHRPWSLPSLGGAFGALAVATSQLIAYLLLSAVILGFITLLVWALYRFRPGREKISEPVEDLPAPKPRTEVPAWTPIDGDPEALAAAGKFEEAIVVLLVHSLKRAGWSPHRQRSMTAREVVLSLGAQDRRRKPLGQVVATAESVRFAGKAATLAAYERMKRWSLEVSASEQAP